MPSSYPTLTVAPCCLPCPAVAAYSNYIDRTNLAFASVQLNKDIGLSPTVYGLGSGLFFISYAFFQLPSNIALDFFGGPLWISFICATWGAVAAGFAGIQNEATFLALRFLLGIFEAGAFPGMVYYVSCFYPRNRTQVPMTGEWRTLPLCLSAC
jgi:ACS family tartrate transporter-like MFS transporter